MPLYRLNISARGVWATGQRSFFDVRVLNNKHQGYLRRSETHSKVKTAFYELKLSKKL